MTTTADFPTPATTLQMIRAEISVRDFQRWMGTKRLQDPDHAMHCLLTECFGRLAPKPFRLIVPHRASTGVLYGYGQASADDLRETSAICADPLQTRILPAGGMDSKPMPSVWQEGKPLGFEIRIRPVVRLERDTSRIPSGLQRRFKEGGLRPGKECDAFLYEAIKHPEKGGMKRPREEVYAEWLSGQIDRKGGATLEADKAKLVSFQRTHAVRKLHARHSEGPDAVMRGVLTVTDPEAFVALLSHGIGRHRSYGYGMMLLHPTRE
jgi:CRISPR system Cascade subunit CasE